MRRWLLAAVVVAAGCSSKTVVEPATPGTPAAVVAAERLQACEQAHSLSEATVRSSTRNAAGNPVEDIRACKWPPGAGAEADGFEEVTVTTLNGPGQSESSDATAVDELSGTCESAFQVRYHYAFQGDSHEDPPIRVDVGQVVDAAGAAYMGPSLSFYPNANEGYVVHNGHVVADAAGCA